jgi:regulator of sigma E protease
MDHFFVEFRLYAMVALGIGLVIFVHELGHFLAARWCGVRVEVFSLGFGPRVFGWRRGGTMYQLSLVPLGGYVKMAGEEGLEAGRAPDPDELPAKSVGQRFLIYSGGVIMNMVFALIVFPLILMAGVPFPEPIVDVTPGGPAWSAGIEPGTRVVSVNGNPVYAFHHIVNEVALGSPEGLDLVVLPPGSTSPRSVHVVPEYEKDMGFYAIGVSQDPDPLARVELAPGSPAADAGIKDGDRVVGVEGGIPGLPILDQLAEQMQAGGSVTARFRRADGSEYDATIEPRAGPKPSKILGVMSMFDRVADVRPTPLAAATGVRKDDRILSIGERRIERAFDVLRALRAVETGPDEAARTLTTRVERDGRELALNGPVLKPGDALALHKDLAVLPDRESTRIVVMPGSAAAAAGLRTGDRIAKIDDKEVSRYADILDAVKKLDGGAALSLVVERGFGDGRETFTAQVAPAPLPQPEYGLNIREATYIYKASSPVDAVKVGLASSWKLVQESWLTLKRILLGSVSGSNIGGIITIGVVSHNWAADGLAKLLFFLCMLSVNLAFLNVLPIPVLDGGHLFFLIVEKVKGSPVSERVLGYSQLVGIVLIVSLMIYVTYNDVVRWILK